MHSCIFIHQTTDHPLIRHPVLSRCHLEEIHALPTKRQRYLDPVIGDHKLIRRRQRIGNSGSDALRRFFILSPIRI